MKNEVDVPSEDWTIVEIGLKIIWNIILYR